jgi:hypothetical protein
LEWSFSQSDIQLFFKSSDDKKHPPKQGSDGRYSFARILLCPSFAESCLQKLSAKTHAIDRQPVPLSQGTLLAVI